MEPESWATKVMVMQGGRFGGGGGQRRIGGGHVNPYDLPGHLLVDKQDPHENRWVPFALAHKAEDEDGNQNRSEREVPGLMKLVMYEVQHRRRIRGNRTGTGLAAGDDSRIKGDDREGDEKMEVLTENHDREGGGEDRDSGWDWLKGKTVVLYGDSVLRYNMDHFCKFVGSEIKPIPWNSPAGVPWPENVNPYSTPHRPFDPDDSSEQDGSGWKDSKPDPPGNGNHWPHICYVEEVDFLVVHVHQYGMDLTDYWTFKNGIIPPTSTDLRVDRLLRPVVKSIMASIARNASNPKSNVVGPVTTDLRQGRQAPDLIQVNTALWDTARWLRLDLENDRSTIDGLSSDRLTWWKRRVRGVANVLRKAYPDVPIQWVTHHYPISGNLDWFTQDIPKTNQPDNQLPRANSLVRFVQLRQTLEAALRGPPAEPTEWCDADCVREQYESAKSVSIGRWGDHMLGMERYMLDALHPAALPGGYLWGDMMLYELYRVRR
ncbi:hypothetical protein HD553DRAFT_350493 [Filobasidium floriforme]|uniref:uncharacterized protein n=1 Tax=Filobasidium floriforme TaxID=5210 RepID=UPI001E8D3136|nr:uncharacterized protein HD553DRAFT_350493 [Filobasidium floriforme]KAH8083497.1 hypothetical protein HD553DRAFT_350493 [Filobasidium floriforme]